MHEIDQEQKKVDKLIEAISFNEPQIGEVLKFLNERNQQLQTRVDYLESLPYPIK
jgi:hypothetical protein